jgi:type II secretory pathway pseudopilin PulG
MHFPKSPAKNTKQRKIFVKVSLMKKQKEKQNGFSTTELVVAAAITSSLAAIGTPAYLSQVNANCQRQAETITGQLMTQYQAYYDEYRDTPSGWSDLDKMTTIMSTVGPASGGNFSPISLGSCRNEFTGEKFNEYFIFTAYPSKEGQSQPVQDDTEAPELEYIDALNVAGCINTSTGASAIKRGDGQKPASPSDLPC